MQTSAKSSGGGGGESGSSSKEAGLEEAISAVERLKKNTGLKELYSRLRGEREKATFTMMMKMNPMALTNIRKEFFVREDALTLDEFIYVINKHLVNRDGTDNFVMETPEQREFGSNMYELFKDIDVNGDGDLEWQEYTTFTVEKANLLNKRAKMASIAHYHDSSRRLDPSAFYRHRNDISKMVNFPASNQFVLVEDTKRSLFVFNSRLGKQIATINMDSAPIAMASVDDQKGLMVVSNADMTMSTFSLDDPSASKRYQQLTMWATPGVQMALRYMPINKLMYSGATNGDVYSWKIEERKMTSTLSGHSDIVMSLCELNKLNYLASASLDKTISIWDVFTNERLLHFQGHRKGVLDLAYTSDYRLLFSCGFEHDALVWSPFVQNCVAKLKGHHHALIGVQTIQDTPELITGDTGGVFKLWDVRKFECVQTFSAPNFNDSEDGGATGNAKMNCFFHTKLRSRNAMQKEDDSRVYAASKLLCSFDQARVVHEATTDYHNIFIVFWNVESSVIITVSERTVIVWDALIGSKTVTCVNIMGGDGEITAACLDDRKRKMVIGNSKGEIRVYNHLNGAEMKTSSGAPIPFPVVTLEYMDESRRFIAGYSNGIVRVFDENAMEDCCVVRTFDSFNNHKELLGITFNAKDGTLITAGSRDGLVRMWDYDAAKCVFELYVCSPEDSIVSIVQLFPLPLIATSDSAGNVTFWGTRGSRFAGTRIAAFLNQTITTAITEVRRKRKDDNDKDADRPMRSMAPVPNEESDEAQAATEAVESDNDQENGGEGVIPDEGDDTATLNEDGTESVSTKSFVSIDALKRKKLKDKTFVEDVNLEKKMETERQVLALFADSEAKCGRVTAAQTMAFEESVGLFFTADDLGVLRCFSIGNMLADMTATSIGSTNPKQNIRGLCRRMKRNDVSALPPLPINGLPNNLGVSYLVGWDEDAMSYMGVDFKWSLTAHEDRIIHCKTTLQGVFTSGADKLVKMWTFEGLPIGVLLQSVPTGAFSSTWDLDLDVEAIMAREDEELDEVILQVKELTAAGEQPDIYEADYTGMEPGSESADYTQSELRQRIEKTGANLGLDFPTGGERAQAIVNGRDEEDPDIGSITSSNKSKTLTNALKELRSTRAASEFREQKKDLTEMEKRRRDKQLEEILGKYEEKGGERIDLKFGDTLEKDDGKLDLITAHSKSKEESIAVDAMYSLASSVGPEVSMMLKNSVRGVGARDSSLNTSILKAGAKGARTISMNKSANKYESYSKLEEAIKLDALTLGRKSTSSPAMRPSKPLSNTKLMMLAAARGEPIPIPSRASTGEEKSPSSSLYDEDKGQELSLLSNHASRSVSRAGSEKGERK